MIEGGCRCGACRYTVAVDALPPVYACHCHVCQQLSGSAFGVHALVAEDRFTASGPIMRRDQERDGHVSAQRYCGECLARLFNTNTRRPGLVVIRAGTLDASEALECRAHIFTNYRQRWVALDPAVLQWPEAPEPGAFIAALLPD